MSGDNSAAASYTHLILPVPAVLSFHLPISSSSITHFFLAQQYTMSDDRWLSLLSDGSDLFAVPPQADPELEIEELEEFDSSKVVFPPDDPLQNYRDSTPLPGLISPSEFTYTTESSEDPPTSEYSSMTHSTSNYPSPIDISFSDFDLGSEYNGVGLKHNIFPDSSPFFDSFGPQISPDLFLPVQVVSAQTDDGPYRPSVGISPHSLSTAFQGPPPAYSTDPPRPPYVNHTIPHGSHQEGIHMP
ncbi:hypothetical protein BJY52DRAFT_409886 [Lactarius psammicola]|nr:hypothetical protein BJY52DRAFT_409886 [Lactarius psammicola]